MATQLQHHVHIMYNHPSKHFIKTEETLRVECATKQNLCKLTFGQTHAEAKVQAYIWRGMSSKHMFLIMGKPKERHAQTTT